MNPLSHQFALHGAIVLFFGLLGGIFFARAVKQQRNEVAWRVVHAGGCAAGVMLLALAVPIQWVRLPDVLRLIMAVGFIGGTYVLCLGMYLAALCGTRGIPGGGSVLNKLVAALYAMGTILSFAGCGLLIAGLLVA